MTVHRIRNPHAVARLVASKVWPHQLPPPVFPSDNELLIRAVSLVVNLPTRDGQRIGARDLTPEQAKDLINHYESKWGRL